MHLSRRGFFTGTIAALIAPTLARLAPKPPVPIALDTITAQLELIRPKFQEMFEKQEAVMARIMARGEARWASNQSHFRLPPSNYQDPGPSLSKPFMIKEQT